MNTNTEKKYRIIIIIEGNRLTYNECELLTESDKFFLRFKDKFNTIYRYNKNLIVSMEELKHD